ncbi:MAG: GGDEF domain-containing protein [Gammaproteobacteria bacterium]|nr:GGDEF domain-containing protein [Gammaproteobacteria bacterium]
MADKNLQWKQKYYDSLDDLEKREKKWQSVEDLLKQAISRLTLAAEGNSKSLDSGLAELRTAIRKGKDNLVIHSILESVSKEIIKLDKMAKGVPKGDAGFLTRIIDNMHLTGKAEKKSRKLLKELKSKNPPEQSELIKSFTALLSDVVEQAVLENEKSKGNNKSNGGGFLKNLFSGKNTSSDTPEEPQAKKEKDTKDELSEDKEPSENEKPSDNEEPLASKEPSASKELSADEQVPASQEQEPSSKEASEQKEPLSESMAVAAKEIDQKDTYALVDPREENTEQQTVLNQEQLTSVVATVQNVLESIIDGLEISEEVKEQLKDKIFEVKPTKEIHVLLDDLKDILNESGILEGSDADVESLNNVLEYNELLIRLIEFLPLEDEVKEKAEQLKEDFSHGVSTEELPKALKLIAGLISKMRSNVQQEQKEFERFLKTLNGRLEEVDQYLQNSLRDYQISYQSGIDLDDAVKAQVKGIGDSVSSINNIGDMEKAVQSHLDKILSHIDFHREKESERVAQVEEKNKKLSSELKQLEKESNHLRQQVLESQNKALLDQLTQLPNRLAYDQRLKQEYARWKRYNSTLLIMIWDIDYFKKVNDTYGHQAGDKVLKVVADLLRKNLRETDFVSRFGGEEFVGLMPETTLGGGFKIAEKIRDSIEKLEFHYRGSNVKVTISCGISLFMENDTPEIALGRADKALYQAKEEGRNRCVIAKEP